MSTTQVPIDQVKPGMYLVGIDISWMKSSFFKHRFLIKSEQEIESLANDGVKVIDVNIDKSTISFSKSGAVESKPAETIATAPTKKELKSSSLSKEMEVAKKLRKETIRNLKKIFQSTLEGEPVKQEVFTEIVSDSQDSILRNTHALLSLLHSERQQTDLENHSFNVMSLAIMLGERVDLSDEEITWLGSAALLMDIGWGKLPEGLFKNGSAYTDDEYDIVKQHVDLSVDLLEAGDVDPNVVSLVAKHHERTDGNGYFSYQDDNDIPLMCRILSMADHYNSRIRGYYDSPPMIPASVLKDIYKKAQKGSHDIGLTELLVQLVGIYPVSSLVQLSTKEKGIVTKVNWRDALNPTVEIYYNKDGRNLLKPLIIDLNKQDKSTKNVRKIQTLLNRHEPSVDPQGLMDFTL